ncbi:MAG: enolase C-terminal domain-like protein [Lautropia sp.]
MEPTLVDGLEVNAYTIPTDGLESDGTLEWNRTTIVIVEASAAGVRGLGYTYADVSTARLVATTLSATVTGCDAMAPNRAFGRMLGAVRNLGQVGIAAMAISAVDTALWDLKARLLGVPLATLFGQVRTAASIYGSGGFTSYPIDTLQRQLADWVRQGIGAVKMKIGREPAADPRRIAAARDAIGTDAALFVDANGAYTRKQALAIGDHLVAQAVRWYEEPVSSDDLEGLRLIRDRAPAGIDVAAGEYAFEIGAFARMLAAGAVDVLQADATRCGGYTGFLQAAALCEAQRIPLSSHCAPALHVPIACAARPFVHAEYFVDHARIERMLFDGANEPRGGVIEPDLDRPGHGLALRRDVARRYAA